MARPRDTSSRESAIGGLVTPRPGLAAARKRAGFNQQAFADTVGVTKHTVSQWETGATGVNPKRRPLLAYALRISLEELDRLLQGQRLDPPNLGSQDEPDKDEPPTIQVLGTGPVTIAGQVAYIKLVRLPGSKPAVYVPGFVVFSDDG